MHICIIHINRLTGRSRRSRDPTHYWAYDRFSAPYDNPVTVRLPYDMRGYSRRTLYSRRSSSPTCMRRVEVARTRSPSVLFRSQWRRNYGDRGYPQVQDLYPVYPPSQRCGLRQHFQQTTLTTRLYKVRTNLYPPPLRKLSDAPARS